MAEADRQQGGASEAPAAGSSLVQGPFTADTYIAERLEQYQGWYDVKAVRMKSLYLRMRTAAVVSGTLVPALINVPLTWVRVVTTVLSLIVVGLVSLESVFHYREQWKNYRATEQLLGHEKVRFRARIGVYAGLSDEEALATLIDRAETAIAAENSSTLNTMTVAGQTWEPQNDAR
jgi:hypothetical protein